MGCFAQSDRKSARKRKDWNTIGVADCGRSFEVYDMKYPAKKEAEILMQPPESIL